MNKPKYILSASGKFLYFEIGRILQERNQLVKIICGYPWVKLKKENIPSSFVIASGFFNMLQYPFLSSMQFKSYLDFMSILNKKNIDRLTCNFLDKNDDADVLLGLSGVSLNSAKKITGKNKIFVCDRTSSHIVYQNNLLAEEYKINNRRYFQTHNWFLDNEVKEYEMADIILVPSNFVKNSFGKELIKKVKVINFGVNTQNFFKDFNIKKSEKCFDILFIGQISLRKGLHYLIDAFHKFKHPNKRLHIVGSHTLDKDFFEEKIKHDKIIYYGHVNHLKLNNIINKSHIFVLPSIEEGFATVILQAIAAGCPVIVTENTGASEYVENNKCGYSVPIRDVDAITDKLEIVAENNDLLNEFSNNATRCTQKNTWSDYVNKLDEIIKEHKNNII